MPDTPRAIGVIMDGNRRWARARGLPTLEGHRQGFAKIEELMHWSKVAGIEEVTLYAFSTENWNRSEEEVTYLLELFKEAFDSGLDPIRKAGFRIRFIGERARFTDAFKDRMRAVEEGTRDGQAGTLVVALSYGGRAEIVAAAQRLLDAGMRAVDEAAFADALYTRGLRDPDLVIRTGGEQRLSNFLSWQTAYSELFFLDTLWPDFSHEDFIGVLDAYAARERRHGK